MRLPWTKSKNTDAPGWVATFPIKVAPGTMSHPRDKNWSIDSLMDADRHQRMRDNQFWLEDDGGESWGDHRKSSLPNLPAPSSDSGPMTSERMSDVLKGVWNTQAMKNQFMHQIYGAKNQSYEDRAWESAVASIERREAARAEWPWPEQ